MNVALAVLHITRGWNQRELAAAAGTHGSAISDYERTKTYPELATLERIVAAMGYPFGALEQARAFVGHLRSQAARSRLAPLPRP